VVQTPADSWFPLLLFCFFGLVACRSLSFPVFSWAAQASRLFVWLWLPSFQCHYNHDHDNYNKRIEKKKDACEDSNPNCNNQQLQEIALLDQLMQAVSIPIVYCDATNWQMYDGGILDTQLCSSTLEAGNHVVELTGVASDPVTGVPYWYLRNSWGEKWGEKGLIRVPFGVNACGLANWVVVPIPPPFIQGRTQEETRANAAASGMSSDPRNVMPANEQLPMPDKATAAAADAINNPKRPTVVQSRDAGIIGDSSSGIKFNF
jgi:hypothetical protein